MHKSTLRTRIRTQRQSLSPREQLSAAQALCQNITELPQYQQATHLALYFANDGEISPHLIAQMAHSQNKQVYYPALTPQDMVFRSYRLGDTLLNNRFGIAEPPPCNPPIAATQLDLVLLPLVAFDTQGNRLGMGGGFYDRTFAFKRQQPFTQPQLIGIAHQLQEQPSLETESWDIAMDFIVTDKKVVRTRKEMV